MTDDTPQLISRGVVSFFAEEIEKLKGSDAYREVSRAVCFLATFLASLLAERGPVPRCHVTQVAEHALAKLHGQVVSFDDAVGDFFSCIRLPLVSIKQDDS